MIGKTRAAVWRQCRDVLPEWGEVGGHWQVTRVQSLTRTTDIYYVCTALIDSRTHKFVR